MAGGESSPGMKSPGRLQPATARHRSESPKQKNTNRITSPLDSGFVRNNTMARRGAGRLKPIDEGVKQDVTPDLVSSGYMDLGKVADGMCQAYLTFKLNQTTARDLSMLRNCRHLQRLELSKNELIQLRHLSGMENLVYLNVSDNMLTDLLDIPQPAPNNLRGADFRSNRITGFKHTAAKLKSFSNLSHLALDRNCITSAVGLSALSSLLNLSITDNKLSGCEGLEALTSLVHLDLSFNCITSILPLHNMSRLRVLLVTDNHLGSLNGLSGCKSLNRLDVRENRISVLSDVADAAQCPLLGTLNLSANSAQKCMDYRLHIVFMLPQVTNLDGLLVDEREKVHAQNLHGADAEGLKRTRDHHFPHGELDDGGGAIPPIAAGLLPDHGSGTIPGGSGPEDFDRIDAVVDALPLSSAAEGVLAVGDFLQEHMHTQLELARAVFRWLVRNITFPADDSWGQSVTAPLLPGHEEIEEKLHSTSSTGTWSERAALLFVALAKSCHLEAVTLSGFWRHEGLQPGMGLIAHNHCWNAIKVDGLWRLVDCGDGARLHGHTYGFFTAPEHFHTAYQPLNAPWSLRRDYISDQAFFSQMWASVRFFKTGCRVLDPMRGSAVVELPAPMEGLPLPVQCMKLAIAPGYRVTHKLFTVCGRQLYPFDKKPWEVPDLAWESRPGVPIFQDVGAGPDEIEMVDAPSGELPCRVHRLAVALPEPGEYLHTVYLAKELPGAIVCTLPDTATLHLNLEDRFVALRVKYVLPQAIANTDVGCPVASTETPQCSLPQCTPLCAVLGVQLMEPPVSLQLEADRKQQFTLRAPGMSQMMLVPRATLSGDTAPCTAPLQSTVTTPSNDGGRQGGNTTNAIELPWDEESQAFSTCIVIPRVSALDVVARRHAAASWQQLMQLQVLPEGQHLRERPDLVFEPPEPDPKDPRMKQVRDIMKNVDVDGDSLISKKEYLVKIRKDRKYADFLKMPPRVCQADGTLEQFFDIFHTINCSRTGKFTQNELAYYLGCNPRSELSSERSLAAVGGVACDA